MFHSKRKTPGGKSRRAFGCSTPRLPQRREHGQPVSRHANLGCNSLRHKGLNDVTFLDIIRITDVDPAFHAIAHFAGIVFEALERANFAFIHLDPVTPQPPFTVALHYSIPHVTPTTDP